jgi:hypothetical protein
MPLRINRRKDPLVFYRLILSILTLIYNIYHVFFRVPHFLWQLDIHNFPESHIFDGIFISHIL